MTAGNDTLFPLLTQPFNLKNLELRNRLVFAPMVTNYANPDGTVTEDLIQFVTDRARAGVGLVIVGNTSVNQAGKLFPNTQLDRDEQVEGFSKLFQSIHDEGAKAFVQLDHEGRETSPDATGGKGPVAPSPIASPTFQITPRELTTEEIKDTVKDYISAAARAQKAGADGVELQGAHGFLIHQFLSPRLNQRSDDYGGSLENRVRFVGEIIKGIKETCGQDFVVCCRISGDAYVEGGLTLDQTVPISQLMQKEGADVIHVAAGVLEAVTHVTPTADMEDAPHAHLSEAIRSAVGIPVIAVGKIPSLSKAEELIEEGKADLIAMGRPLLADSQLPTKELSGKADEVIRCEFCNECLNKILSPEPRVECKLHKKE